MSRYLSTQEYVTHIGKGIKNVVLTFAILLAKTKNMSTSMQWCDTNIGIESENTLPAKIKLLKILNTAKAPFYLDDCILI